MKPRTQKIASPAAGRAPTQRDASKRKLVSKIEMLGMRVEAAEAAWKTAKEQASQARRRRKLAKLLAKRAKKHAKAARLHFDTMRTALAEAEARSAATGGPAAVRKASKARTAEVKKRKSSTRRVRHRSADAVSTSAREPWGTRTAREHPFGDMDRALSSACRVPWPWQPRPD